MRYNGIKIEGKYYAGISGDISYEEEYIDYRGNHHIDENNKLVVEITEFLGDILINNSKETLDTIPNIIDYNTKRDGENYFLDFLSFYPVVSLRPQVDDGFVKSIESVLQEETNNLIDSLVRYRKENRKINHILFFDGSVKINPRLTTRGFYLSFKDAENVISIGIPIDKLEKL